MVVANASASIWLAPHSLSDRKKAKTRVLSKQLSIHYCQLINDDIRHQYCFSCWNWKLKEGTSPHRLTLLTLKSINTPPKYVVHPFLLQIYTFSFFCYCMVLTFFFLCALYSGSFRLPGSHSDPTDARLHPQGIVICFA